MTPKIPFRRVLIVADESADWIIAGLPQLDRLFLAIDEFALENNETAPVLVCIFWRPDLEAAQRWVPRNEQVTRIAFTTELDGKPFDLILGTRLFLYRKAIRKLLESSVVPVGETVSSGKMELWESNFHSIETLPPFCERAWEYVKTGEQIDEIEIRFLRECGKSQDSLVSWYLDRRISRFISRLLLRFPTTPNAFTWLIFPIAIVAALILCNGTYGSFVWALLLFEVFSILDGCDGEIARARYLESERGRQLDHLFDVCGNILLVLGLGFGLAKQASLAGHSGWFYTLEGTVAALLIGMNESYLGSRSVGESAGELEALDGLLYPRHRELVERSGILLLGRRFTYWAIQLTKRDFAALFFVFLAIVGLPSLILHLLIVVAAITLTLALRSRLPQQSAPEV